MSEYRFRPAGCARLAAVPFLLGWLAFWAVFEFFALRFLLTALKGDPELLRRTLSQPAGWVGAGFVVLWLAGWTLGGIVAMIRILRLLAGADVLKVEGEEWTVWHGVGPFGLSRSIPASDVLDVFVHRRRLVIETTRRNVVVTTDGSPEAMQQVVAHHSRRETALDQLPRTWTDGMHDGQMCIRRGSREWHLGRDHVAQIAGVGGWRKEKIIDSDSLEVTGGFTSKGHEWVELSGRSGGKRVTLLQTVDDPRTVLRLARRIARVTGWSIRAQQEYAGV